MFLLWGWDKAPFLVSLIPQSQSLRLSPDTFIGSPMNAVSPEPKKDADNLPNSATNEASDKPEGYDKKSNGEDGENFKEKVWDASVPVDSANTSSVFTKKEKGNIPYQVKKQTCDYAKGNWVADDNRPFYSGGRCLQWLSEMWACRLTDRTDFAFEKFRWQPRDCEMEEFSGKKFLRRSVMVNQAQRLDGLEAEVAGIKEQVEAFQNTFAQQLATAMQNAIPTLQQSFAEQFARSLEALNSKQNDELAALSIQLEGRIDRSRENQEMAIAVMRNEQANFQTEIRAVATELRAIKRNPHHALNHRKRVIIIGVALPSDAMRNKTLAFIGDSLGRQQYQSLMCMVSGGKLRHDVIDVGWEYGLVKARGALRPDGWAHRFTRTNTTILFYWSACLCDLQPVNPSDKNSEVAMNLDRPPAFLRRYLDRFNVIVLNTGHHWNRGKFDGNHWVMHVGGVPNLNKNVAEAKNFTIHSIVKWVDSQLPQHPKLRAVYRSLSPRHFFNGDWNSGGTCDNTNPLSKGKEVLKEESGDPAAAMAVKGTKVKYLDITALSELRDEGHMSRYTIKPRQATGQDCLHWCLPGIPDAWNEILYGQLSALGRF
ncbi:hypothetical protein SOVF_150890 isoform A [Spinacia oleracea]|nr:hypothetical protein SOVF_150890 isoform A [Spinacia oleracea]